MPWCEECSRRWEDEELTEAGACPRCGAYLAGPTRVPWHFKFLAAGTAIYLLWRLGQGLDWLARYAGRHI